MTRRLPFTLLVSALALNACSRQEPPPPPDRPVKLMTVGAGTVAATAELAGEVRARVESSLGFRVNGKIIARQVETGQRVRRGDELARLDPRDFEIAGQSAGSALIAASARMDNARAEFARYQELSRKGFVSATDMERKRVELSAAEAQQEQAQSGLSLEQNRLTDTVLRADADGVVTAVLADVGEGVSAGQPVIRVAQDGPREIEVEFPENRTALARAARAQVALWATPGARLPAALRELSAAADPQTRTFRARYTVKAPAGSLALGQSATLYLQLPAMKSGATRLPTTALFGKQGETLVWLYDEKSATVKRQPVKSVGVDGGDVLVAGLAPGQQVVIAGVHVLSEGQKVRPFVDTSAR
ncbi:MAG: putative transport/efflux transrane protein [Moraxellaceae bacterium]|jgi:RND family efflux transporter MFP subunit|nr:putative transport/efflux transrane protein [Moraxellaceae bacterium]